MDGGNSLDDLTIKKGNNMSQEEQLRIEENKSNMRL